MVPLNSVCAYNTQSFFILYFICIEFLWLQFCSNVPLISSFYSICFAGIFCTNQLLSVRFHFFLHSHYSSLAMPYSSKLIYHLPVQHVAICHVSGVSTKLCISSGNQSVLCVGSPINIFQVSASSCIT